ncbi:MAG: V-type ATP synthase subunit I [Ruminococcaceae bacterium]|nr:V-type ATP synthase subunit I [Oscillospiraceae bacterium]
MSVSKMKRLTVFAFRKDADRIVRKLMNLRCVEVRQADSERGEEVLPYLKAESELAQINRNLLQIRQAIPILAKYCRKKGLARRVLHVNREQFVNSGRAAAALELAGRTLELQNSQKENEARQGELRSLCEALSPWIGYETLLNDPGTQKTITILGTFPPTVDSVLLQSQLDEAGIAGEPVKTDETGIYFALTFLRAEENEINTFLVGKGFQKVDLPKKETTARELQARLTKEIAGLEQQFRQNEERFAKLAEGKDDVEILSDIEETNRTAAELKQRLAQTEHCVILDGWVPASMEKTVAEALDAFECAYETEDPTPEDEPPVLLRNNWFAANFEWVIGMYSYPRYGTFDPTFIMSIFYMIIFGLMFADFGYGLLLSVLCFAGIKILNPRASMKRMLMMFGFCGISSALMGAIFGGWFGNLPVAIMEQVAPNAINSTAGHIFASGLWFNPLDDPMTFLVLSLGVGAIHIIAGMAIKFVVLCKEKHALEAICTILPYWVLFAGLGMLVVGIAKPGLIPSGVAQWVSIAGAAMILLLNGVGQKSFFQWLIKGLGGLYGLISYASDLLSYSRILALGMVAGVIAKVINMITAMGTTGPIGFLLMLIILILGHGLNIAINILGTFVHAARLQYIEFFGKFYEDGGEPFNPALPTEEYSEDMTEGSN